MSTAFANDATRSPVHHGAVEIAIVGAGPYGLSLAAHLRAAGVAFRIFGQPMEGWLSHMPKGMYLKSEGFASNLYDPEGRCTLKQFCAERGIAYADSGLPVSLETFVAYGRRFQERLVPQMERDLVVALDSAYGAFQLHLQTGETVLARRVVLAVGIAEFGYVPETLAWLPPQFLSHSSRHHDLERFSGRAVAVIGGGSSAIDFAGLLHDARAQVTLIARRPVLRFHTPPTGEARTLWQRIRYPMTGMGPGLRARLYADAPLVFHCLPLKLRRDILADFAPPEGGWFSREKVVGRVPLLLGHSVVGAEIRGGKAVVRLQDTNGAERVVTADHIIAATGYRADVDRLGFLSKRILSQLKLAGQVPVLSTSFQSSVPGLYFVGLASALSFGPMMRFALGAGFTARQLTRALTSPRRQSRAARSEPRVATP